MVPEVDAVEHQCVEVVVVDSPVVRHEVEEVDSAPVDVEAVDSLPVVQAVVVSREEHQGDVVSVVVEGVRRVIILRVKGKWALWALVYFRELCTILTAAIEGWRQSCQITLLNERNGIGYY